MGVSFFPYSFVDQSAYSQDYEYDYLLWVLSGFAIQQATQVPERWDSNPANHLSKQLPWVRARKLADNIDHCRIGCTASEDDEPMPGQREPIHMGPDQGPPCAAPTDWHHCGCT